MRRLVVKRQKFVTVYTAIYCRKYFKVINYFTFRYMACGFMVLVMLKIEIKLPECIRMGITIFKSFIWGDIPSGYMVGNHVLRVHSHVAVKLNFQPYI